jgi:hypothetical protein
MLICICNWYLFDRINWFLAPESDSDRRRWQWYDHYDEACNYNYCDNHGNNYENDSYYYQDHIIHIILRYSHSSGSDFR